MHWNQTSDSKLNILKNINQVESDSSESEEDDDEEGENDNVQTEVVKPLKSDNKWLAAEQDDSEEAEGCCFCQYF